MLVVMTNHEGPTIRERREALFLSRSQLSMASGVSASSIEKFEEGHFPARSPALRKLLVTLAELEQRARAAV